MTPERLEEIRELSRYLHMVNGNTSSTATALDELLTLVDRLRSRLAWYRWNERREMQFLDLVGRGE